MTETPVLFETFVRTDYARKVWDAIKAAQPKKLYFYSNKGRADREGEIERNEEIRSWVNEIDWECELHTWFRDECVNQYVSLKGAMDWIFDNEERAIVLEDDCVASLAFFSFCDQMLDKFNDDKRVWLISGDNYLEDYNPHKTDYIFTRDFQIYGWASWSDRWHAIEWDNTFEDFENKQIFEIAYQSKRMAKFQYYRMFSELELIKKTNCWDFVFMYNALANGGLCAIPSFNLVENIGLSGVHASTGKRSMFNAPVTFKSEVYLINNEPKYIIQDNLYEKESFARRWAGTQSIIFKLKIQLSRKFQSFYKILRNVKQNEKSHNV